MTSVALVAASTTLVMVEHRVEAALGLVDRVVVLEPGGGISDDGAPERVFGRRGADLAARGVWVPAPWGLPPGGVRVKAAAGRSVLAGESLGRRYPGGAGVEHADLVLHAGEAVALTGPNGSGKTTLALLLAGLDRPDTGAARLVDDPALPLHRWPARRLCRRVGTVFQDPEHQFLAGRVDEELMVGPRRAGLPDALARARRDELLARLHLDRLAGANPFTLSGGEQRRLSVATALATAPDVLVLDEPTFGQDARTWTELLGLCADLRDEGTAVLAVTHDEPFAAALADRRLAMSTGRLEPDSDPATAAAGEPR